MTVHVNVEIQRSLTVGIRGAFSVRYKVVIKAIAVIFCTTRRYIRVAYTCRTRKHWIQSITFAAETPVNAARLTDTHSVTARHRHNTFSAR